MILVHKSLLVTQGISLDIYFIIRVINSYIFVNCIKIIRSIDSFLSMLQVFYYRSAQHQNHYVLSFAFAFDREDDVYQFALTYPYSYTRYMAHLDNLCSRLLYTRRETLAESIQKRNVELVTITSDLEDTERPRKVVVVLARVHPGESPSSFVCQGLMDFLVSAHPIAQVLREYVIFKIVPMLNPDGVFLGNYR